MSYATKKEECKKRVIKFDFTEEEWNALQAYKYKTRCAYTNNEFNPSRKHKFFPTLERIDASGPYNKDNCVWVTAFANNLKNLFIESNRDESKLPKYETDQLRHIRRILESPEELSKLKEEYAKIYAKDNLLETLHPLHDDNVSIAEEYATLGRVLEGKGMELTATFTQYRALLRRKTCMLSNNPLDPDFRKRMVCLRGLAIKDKYRTPSTKVMKEVTIDDLLVVDKDVKETVDKLSRSCNTIGVELSTLLKIVLSSGYTQKMIGAC